MTIVVGVSPTTGSPTALRWAAEEAKLRNVPVRAVLAWRPPSAPAASGGRPPAGTAFAASNDYEGDAERTLREYVTTALGSDDAVECVAVRGGAVKALLSTATGADLLVIGEARSGRLASERSARLVAPRVVLKAPCPVVVMAGVEATTS
jgi:nucleotide-binding universal stress UspA family protein